MCIWLCICSVSAKKLDTLCIQCICNPSPVNLPSRVRCYLTRCLTPSLSRSSVNPWSASAPGPERLGNQKKKQRKNCLSQLWPTFGCEQREVRKKVQRQCALGPGCAEHRMDSVSSPAEKVALRCTFVGLLQLILAHWRGACVSGRAF